MRSLLLLLFALGAHAAGQARFALVLGANEGEPGEETLLFAEEDASRFADVLTRYAAVPEENILLLRGRSSERVVEAVSGLADRVRAATAKGQETVLFAYYSGHADAQAMHLGSSLLRFAELKGLIDETGARLSVLVVDACRSGELTRVKGAVPAQPFDIHADDKLASEGSAIITSSAAGEDAQESDRLGGGVFTHHFVIGLLGAADASRDERVTLSEAYRYAYEETLRTTSRARFVQHPTYAFRMKGREDLVVTRLTDSGGLGRLQLSEAGAYVLLPDGDRGRIVELSAKGPIEVLVEPGGYVVRRRGDDGFHEARARVSSGAAAVVRDFHVVPYGRSVRKGYGGRRLALAMTTGGEIGGPITKGMGPGLGGSLGLRTDLRALTLELGLRYGYGAGENEDLDITQQQLGAVLTAWRLFDLGDFAAGFGLRVGGDYVMQRFDTQGEAPDRDALIGRAGAALRLEYALSQTINLGLTAGVDAWLLDRDTLRAVPSGGLGLAVYFQ